MIRAKTPGLLVPLALLAAATTAPAGAQSSSSRAASASAPLRPETEYRGAAELGLALRRLGATGRVLMIGAHPDDEDTQLLARLALGGGADVAYLSLTRGEGGQNAIGPDFQEALGIIRTEELLAARRADGALQFFGREYDYGFSKSADEAFRHWPRDSVLADVVRVIRRFRPDAIVSVFTGTPRDGHGQHQAAGIVAKEGFGAAADPTRFPEQIAAGLAPWRTAKLYEGGYFRQDSLSTSYATGAIDPLLGLSYAEIAVISRGRHRSQSVGRALPPGPRTTAVNLVESRARAPGGRPERSMFQGLDTTLTARAAAALGASAPATRLLAAYDDSVAAVRRELNPFAPDDVVSALLHAVPLLRSADATLDTVPAGAALRWYIAEELGDATAALAAAQRLVLDATAPAEQVTPGAPVEVTQTVWNGGARPVTWQLTRDSSITVGPGQLVSRPVRISAPATVTQPYFLRTERRGDLYTWPSVDGVSGLPFEPPVTVGFDVAIGGVPVRITREVTYRAISQVEGESRRPLRVVPAVSVLMDRAVTVRPLDARTPLSLAVRLAEEAGASSSGELRLRLPAGWSATPASAAVQLGSGEVRDISFAVTPPPGLRAGRFELAASFRAAGGREYTRGFRLIDYPHIRPYPLYADAHTTVEAVDVVIPPALRARPVGYIMGAGDDVPAALEQLGIAVEPLPARSLAAGGTDLARYATIVVGVRAYDTRPELIGANQRLLEWVRNGGTLLVQYQQAVWAERQLAPYPVTFGRPADRVTDEAAAVTVLEPAAPLLNQPNRIGPRDWEGWVQERGLWFPRSWDEHWQPLLQMADPGETTQRGALLVARYGQGTVIYTGLSFFRQLPAGVPGAYRLFVNLLAGMR